MNKHKRLWRVAILALMVVAIIGPWAYDRINVPAEYPCSAPFIRLEGDFCGVPLSGIWSLSALTGMIADIVVGVVTGRVVFSDRAREFSIALLGLLFILPIFSSLFLVLRGDSLRRSVFHVVVLGLAAGLGLLLVMSSPLKPFWLLWGPWLYVGLVASALILEVVMLATGRRTAEG